MVTRRPRDFRSRPREEAVSPFPRELMTPPVTNTNFVTFSSRRGLFKVTGGTGTRDGLRAHRKQLFRVPTCRSAVRVAREHSRQLDDAVLAFYMARPRHGAAVRLAL